MFMPLCFAGLVVGDPNDGGRRRQIAGPQPGPARGGVSGTTWVLSAPEIDQIGVCC